MGAWGGGSAGGAHPRTSPSNSGCGSPELGCLVSRATSPHEPDSHLLVNLKTACKEKTLLPLCLPESHPADQGPSGGGESPLGAE